MVRIFSALVSGQGEGSKRTYMAIDKMLRLNDYYHLYHALNKENSAYFFFYRFMYPK